MIEECDKALQDAMTLPALGVPAPIVVEANTLRSKLASLRKTGRQKVAIVGRYSAGKSALVNALIGKYLLPSYMDPTSAFPVGIINTSESICRVRIAEGDRVVRRRVNPKDIQRVLGGAVSGVRKMELALPISFLPLGAELWDTPGLQNPQGDEGGRHAEYAHATFKSVNRVVVVTNQYGLHEEDLELLGLAHQQGKEVVVVHNKADLVTDPSDRRKVVAATVRTLGQLFPGWTIPVLWVSAVTALEGDMGVSRLSELRRVLASDWFVPLYPLEELLSIVLRWREVTEVWAVDDWLRHPADRDADEIVAYLRARAMGSFQVFALEQLERELGGGRMPENRLRALRERLPIFVRAGIPMPHGDVRTMVCDTARAVFVPVVRTIGDTFLQFHDMNRTFARRLADAGFGEHILPSSQSLAFWQFSYLAGINRKDARQDLTWRWQEMPEIERLKEFTQLRDALTRRADRLMPDCESGDGLP
jgi:GTP-binding protein EngB required for normal cell division